MYFLFCNLDISLYVINKMVLVREDWIVFTFFFFPYFRELVEELHPLMKEALERRPEVS